MCADSFFLLVVRFAGTAEFESLAGVETTIPRFFQAAVLLHTALGLTLAFGALVFFVSHLRVVWRRRGSASVMSGSLLLAGSTTLVLTGLFILTDAASRENRWVWWLHVLCAGLMVATYLRHRFTSVSKLTPASLRRFGLAVAGGGIALMLVQAFVVRESRQTAEARLALELGHDSGPGSKNRVATFPVGFVDPESPFFPSPVTTTSGWYLPPRIITRGESPPGVAEEVRQVGFAASEPIGASACARCHQDVVAQWETSAHRFASMNNPFYAAAANLLRDSSASGNEWIERHVQRFPAASGREGPIKSKWCGGCHDPSIMLAGDMAADIAPETSEAQAGLTCLACHLIDSLHDRTGNGNYNIADDIEDQYIFPNSADGSVGAFLHDAAIKAKPTAHRARMIKPFFRNSEYCATCHKVSLSPPINDYRWLRGQNEFDAWDDSGVSLNASRTFYLPPVKRECQHCHMPLEAAPLGDVAANNGFVRSHRFLAANTALPFVRDDSETQGRTEGFLREGKLSEDIFALRSAAGAPYAMAFDWDGARVTVGDRVTVDVIVRNLGVGHTFPGGTNDSNEGWLEFTIRDRAGNAVATSGFVEGNGDLDPMAHMYNSVMVDANGQPILRRDTQNARATVYANVIGPGSADLAHYQFEIPENFEGQDLTITARLLWRKFNRAYTEFAFAYNPDGFKNFDEAPELPISEIAADTVTVTVGREETAPDPMESNRPETWMRFNDYGIGLLLEGDTRLATMAFERVVELSPDRIDGPLNLARVAITDGNVEAAYEYLLRSEAVSTGDARAAWVWGVVLQEDGRYEEAAMAYRRVLEEFPGDRAAWRNLGRTLYLNAEYVSAIEAFERVLVIDPEDRVSHYHQMLCYRAMGREDAADLAEAAYKYYSIDETAQSLTQRHRLENPGANLMAQRIRIHRLALETSR